MDFALTKENIQPLRGGRNAAQLEVGLQAQHNPQYQETLLQQKQHFENAIRNDTSDDPLETYFQYISWVEQSFPKHGHEGNLTNLLEDCLGRFENDSRYTNDIRYCKLWIKYIDFQLNHTELYQLLYTKGIGIGFADLYKAWAYYYEASGDYKRADQVFRLGKEQRAQPFQELEAAHHNFYYYAGFQMVNQGTAVAVARLADQRQALTNLRSHKQGYVGSVRTGNSNGLTVLPMNPTAQNRQNAPVIVHEDYKDILMGLGESADSILSAVKRDGPKENMMKAGVWTGSLKKSQLVHKTSNIPIHEDVLPPPHIRGIQMPPTFTSTTQQDSSQWQVEIIVADPEDPNKIPMYCKRQCYEDPTTEYSMEEIRARRYLRKMKRQLSLTSAMETDQLAQRSNTSIGSVRHAPQEINTFQSAQMTPLHSTSVTNNIHSSAPQHFTMAPGMASTARTPLMDHAMPNTNPNMECTSSMTNVHQNQSQHVSVVPTLASGRVIPYESPPRQIQSQQLPSTSAEMMHQYNPHMHNSPSVNHHVSHDYNHMQQPMQQQHLIHMPHNHHSMSQLNPHSQEVMHSSPTMHRTPSVHMTSVRHPSPYRNHGLPYDAQASYQQQMNQQQHHQSMMQHQQSLNQDPMVHQHMPTSIHQHQPHHSYQSPHHNQMGYSNLAVSSHHMPPVNYNNPNLMDANSSSPYSNNPSPKLSMSLVFASITPPIKDPQQFQIVETKGNAMKTPLKILNDDELAETGSRGGLDIAAAAQPTDGAKRIACFEDDESYTADYSIAANTEAFNLQLMHVSTPENKKPQEPVAAVEVKSAKKRIFSGLSDITEESNFISSGSSIGTTSAPRSVFGVPKANAMEPIREQSNIYQLNLSQNSLANAELRMKLGLGCDSGPNSPSITPLSYDRQAVINVYEDDKEEEYETPQEHVPYAVLDYKPTDPFTNKVLETFLSHVNFPGRHRKFYKPITGVPKLAVKKEVCYVGKDRYIVDKLLGKGSFGNVYRATQIDTGAVVALKIQKPANKWEFYICREIQARLANHPMRDNFMNVHIGYFSDIASVLVSDVFNGSLLDLINALKPKLSNGPKHHLSIYLTCEMMKIVQALHSIKIIHADIKPDNFLVMVKNDNVQLQLIDFGCSIDMSLMPEGTSFMRKVKTDSFQCCEMKDDRPWNYHTDIYCIAATAHVLLLESYIDLKKTDGRWFITKKIPRYYKDDLWTYFFSSMMNMQEGLPDLDYIISYFTDAIDSKELRTATTFIINSFKN